MTPTTDTAATAADSLRPTTFDSYIGQELMKKRLNVHIESALNRAEPLAHVLLTGPPGAGKTTIAKLIAERFGLPFLSIEMPFNGNDFRDLRGFNGILNLEEVHRPSKPQQEELLPLLEHGFMRPKGRYRMDFPWLTVVATTTELPKIIKPLRDRFTIHPHFDDYSDEEMGLIVKGMAARVDVVLTTDDCIALGRASLGVPRKASHLVQAARDLASAKRRPTTAAEIRDFMRITLDGWTEEHLEYLIVLDRMGGPVGLASLKALLSTDEATIVDIETPLIRRGLVEPTAKGRELTNEGMAVARANGA